MQRDFRPKRASPSARRRRLPEYHRVRRDDREPDDHRLEKRHRAGFRVARQTAGVGCTDYVGDVEAVTRQADGAVIAGEPFETGTLRTVADDERRDPGSRRRASCTAPMKTSMLFSGRRLATSTARKLPAGTPSSARTEVAGLAGVSSGMAFWITEIRSARYPRLDEYRNLGSADGDRPVDAGCHQSGERAAVHGNRETPSAVVYHHLRSTDLSGDAVTDDDCVDAL